MFTQGAQNCGQADLASGKYAGWNSDVATLIERYTTLGCLVTVIHKGNGVDVQFTAQVTGSGEC